MSNPLREKAARVKARAKRALAERGDLHGRLSALEAEVQENRALNRRIAELTDVVAELLLPVAQRDQEKIDDLLENYRKTV